MGNPGKAYANSRHNIGFMMVNALAKDYAIALKKDLSVYALVGKAEISNKAVLLAEPLTFMNLSGIAVKALLKKYKVKPEGLLIICDDLDLELGRIKIKESGSSGGHRGLKSIIDSLANKEFNRLRLGIGRPNQRQDNSEYVLTGFAKKEKKSLTELIEKSCDCAESWISDGMAKTMNIFNQKGVK